MMASSPLLSSTVTRKEEEKMLNSSNPSFRHYLEGESEDVLRFDKSLQELRDLRSQLHYAANHCEQIFLKAKQKKTVLENTKEYICNAVVTVVDHLGSVSANLDCQITKNNPVSEAELRLNCLKQRLLTCEQYAHKLTLTRLRWRENFPRYHPHYLSTPNGVSRDSDNPSSAKIINMHELNMKEDVPLFLYTNCHKPPLAKNLTSDTAEQKQDTNSVAALPVRDGLSILTKAPNPTFHFQREGIPKLGRNTLLRKSLHSNDILTLLRRTKRTA